MADDQDLGVGGGDNGAQRSFQGNGAYQRFAGCRVMDKEFWIVQVNPQQAL